MASCLKTVPILYGLFRPDSNTISMFIVRLADGVTVQVGMLVGPLEIR